MIYFIPRFHDATIDNKFSPGKDMGSNGMWTDGGADTFDEWGSFTITCNGSSALAFSGGFGNTADGFVFEREVPIGGQLFTVTTGWATKGIFVIHVRPQQPDVQFTLSWGGGLGSDSVTQNGIVTRTFTQADGQECTLKTVWSNDGGRDATGGDPQITRTVVAYISDQMLGDVFTSSFNADKESSNTIQLSAGATIYIQWGYAAVAEVQNWIVDDIEQFVGGTITGAVIDGSGTPLDRTIVFVRRDDRGIWVVDAVATSPGGSYEVETMYSGHAVYGIALPDYGATRTPSTNYAAGDRTFPAVPTGHWYECESAGTTGTTEPVWPTDGSTVADGTVVWRDKGLMEEPIARGPYVVPPDA